MESVKYNYDNVNQEFIAEHLGNKFSLSIGEKDQKAIAFWSLLCDRGNQVLSQYSDLLLSCMDGGREEFLPRPIDWLNSGKSLDKLAKQANEMRQDLEDGGYLVVSAFKPNPFTRGTTSPIIEGLRQVLKFHRDNQTGARFIVEPTKYDNL